MTDKKVRNLTRRLNTGGGNIVNKQIDNWPVSHSLCSVNGCQNKTDQAIAFVTKKDRTIAGRFSQFGRWKSVNGDIVDLKLFPEYQWVRWITRCTQHYAEDCAKLENHREALRK